MKSYCTYVQRLPNDIRRMRSIAAVTPRTSHLCLAVDGSMNYYDALNRYAAGSYRHMECWFNLVGIRLKVIS